MSEERLVKAAEFVTAELLAYIDMDQDWSGWAHQYRDHFEYRAKDFGTLGHALDELRDAIKESEEETAPVQLKAWEWVLLVCSLTILILSSLGGMICFFRFLFSLLNPGA